MIRITYRARPPILALALLVLLGCGDGSPTGPAAEISGLPRALSLSEERLVAAGNDFTFGFLNTIYQTAPDSNLFLSPLSASMALGMTLNGAAGTTFEEMRSTLGFGGMSLAEINEGYRDLIGLLLALDPSVDLGIGNSIWYREGFSVRPDFLERTRSYFDAEVMALDFSQPGAATTINNWVKAETKGKITEIVQDPVDAATLMFLINAIYFKGSWTHRFSKSKTTQAAFTAENGRSGTVPMMELEDTLLYAQTPTYQAVDLPYGGKAFSMTLLLPASNVSVEELVASLDPPTWSEIVGSLRAKVGTVYLPKFRLEWERQLKEDLRAMGMNAPFIGGLADFSGLSDDALQRGIHISKVKQRSYVDVNEEGTEAAAVTVVEMRETSIPDNFFFRADRPFLFVIRERFSETILFAGVLAQAPEA